MSKIQLKRMRIRRSFVKILPLILLIFAAPPLIGQKKKTTVAVLEFQSVGTLEKKEAATLTVRFRALLVNTQAFKVIEREKMNEILKAQDFNMSDACNTSECAVQVGQLLGAEVMIAGDIGKLGETYTIDIRLIDVQTGGVIQSKSRNHKGMIDGLLDVMETIARSLADAAEGRTISKDYSLGITSALPKSAPPQKINILIDSAKVGENGVVLTLREGLHHIFVTTSDSNFTEFRGEVNLVSDQALEVKLEYSDYYQKRIAEESARVQAAAALAAIQKVQREKAERERIERERQAAKELAEKQKTVSQKTSGKSSKAYLSVLFPGLGGFFTEQNKIRSIVTAVSVVGLMAYGLNQKNQADKFYSNYKVSTDRNEINSLFNKANSANHKYYIATRIGAAIWASDIIWVVYKSIKDDKETSSSKFSSSETGLKLSCEDNQLQLRYVVTF